MLSLRSIGNIRWKNLVEYVGSNRKNHEGKNTFLDIVDSFLSGARFLFLKYQRDIKFSCRALSYKKLCCCSNDIQIIYLFSILSRRWSNFLNSNTTNAWLIKILAHKRVKKGNCIFQLITVYLIIAKVLGWYIWNIVSLYLTK